MSPSNPELDSAEQGIGSCPEYEGCNGSSECLLELSSIEPGDERRGNRNPKILLVTEAPDKDSSEQGAYQGTITGRIQSIFCDEKYGIGLRDNSDGFSDFLQNNEIYATSAIKCFVDGNGSQISNHALRTCSNRYLSKQIAAMDQLELIIPMGKVAAASILAQSLSSISITQLVGRSGSGILRRCQNYNYPVVVLPHPSGSNPRANPPVINDRSNVNLRDDKIRFREALKFIREKMNELNYNVLDGNPDCWDSPGGLFEFC